MRVVAAVGAVLLIATILEDAFETMVLPRRVPRRVRLTRLFYHWSWSVWRRIPRWLRLHGSHDLYLSVFGPLSLILLIAAWAAALVVGFGVLQWDVGRGLVGPEGKAGLGGAIYMSGTSFFTLGLGDVSPRTPASRAITVVEVGMGFGFLALVIGYLPVLYQAFSRREVNISLLDARAGSPPTAVELLRRCPIDAGAGGLAMMLQDWERWAAELLESYLSFPVLAFYRSQHDRQSWLAALTMVLDASALVIAGLPGPAVAPARLTYAIACHAAVDLTQVFNQRTAPAGAGRPPTDLARLQPALGPAGTLLQTGPEAEARFAALRAQYEPYIAALSVYLLMPLPDWLPPAGTRDDWQTAPREDHRGDP